MKTTALTICGAADELKGFVGFHRKARHYIVRFSEDAFGMDIDEASIVPACEFVWQPRDNATMTLSRERLRLLLDQNIDGRLNITEPLRVYMRRTDLPEIAAERHAQPVVAR